jgi:hypothetical protein
MIIKYKDFNEQLSMFEVSKEDVVDSIKLISSFTKKYFLDLNKYTINNLNIGFSWSELPKRSDINQIFSLSDSLDYNSDDNLIRSISNEFINWSEASKRSSRSIDVSVDINMIRNEYNKLSDTDKEENKNEIYTQDLLHRLYLLNGREIKKLINGTRWDMPVVKKKLTEEDKNFIEDSLVHDYDLLSDIEVIFSDVSNADGIIVGIPKSKIPTIDIDSDFMYRLQSYFGGVLKKEGYGVNHKIYLPFYSL